MIEHNGKKYYTAFELLDFLNDENSELHAAYKKRFPKYEKSVRLEHINRTLTLARRAKKIQFLEYKKNKDSSKVFFAYAMQDVIDYINTKSNEIYDAKVHEKEENA